MLREYYDWWAGQMLTFVPERLAQALIEDPQVLLVEPERGAALDTVRLSLRRRGETGYLGRFPLEPGLDRQLGAEHAAAGPVWLVLPGDILLEKRLTLPLGASRDLERVLAFEMDRETPFAADEAWWSFAIEQRDRQAGTIAVRLSLIPKAAVRTVLERLSQAGLAPSGIEIAAADGTGRQISMGRLRLPGDRWYARTMPLAAACLVLLVLALVVPFARQSWTMSKLATRMAAIKPEVEEAGKLRKQLDEAGGSDVLAAEHARLGDPLAVLGSATTLLPNDTWLTDFSMAQRRLTMNGQSVGPAKLIGAFAADPTFKDPAFAAPSTHIEGAKTETFSISAEARP
jgi:general secretion pathway protein L